MKTRINSIIAITTLLLSGCGGGDGEESALDKLTNGSSSKQSALDDLVKSSSSKSSSNSSQSSSSGTVADLSYLDCNQLDPSKVYLVGSLAGNSNGTIQVLVDLDNPSSFCAGIELSIQSFGGVISKTGQLLAQQEEDASNTVSLYKINQDPLTLDETTSPAQLRAPKDTTNNDEEIFSRVGYAVFLKQNADTTEEIFVEDSLNYNVYSNLSPDTPYYENTSLRSLMGVMPSGDLLMSNSTGLVLVNSDGELTELDSPTSGPFDFIRTHRLFTDSSSGHQMAWVALQDADDIYRRWTIDLETLSVTDDGEFAAYPESVVNIPGLSNKKIDSSGNLIQVGQYSAAPFDFSPTTFFDPFKYGSVVIRRPIASSGSSSTFLHRDSVYTGEWTWFLEFPPFTHITTGGTLVTGQ